MKPLFISLITVAVASVVLDIVAGVFILLITPTNSTSHTALAIASCILYSFLSAIDIATIFTTTLPHQRIIKSCIVFFTLLSIIFMGSTLGCLLTSDQINTAGEVLCRGNQSCQKSWTGPKALLTAFIFWFATGILQVIYIFLYFTKVSHEPLRRAARHGSATSLRVVEVPSYSDTRIKKDSLTAPDYPQDPEIAGLAIRASTSRSDSISQPGTISPTRKSPRRKSNKRLAPALTIETKHKSSRREPSQDQLLSASSSSDQPEWTGWGFSQLSPSFLSDTSNSQSSASTARTRPKLRTVPSFKSHLTFPTLRTDRSNSISHIPPPHSAFSVDPLELSKVQSSRENNRVLLNSLLPSPTRRQSYLGPMRMPLSKRLSIVSLRDTENFSSPKKRSSILALRTSDSRSTSPDKMARNRSSSPVRRPEPDAFAAWDTSQLAPDMFDDQFDDQFDEDGPNFGSRKGSESSNLTTRSTDKWDGRSVRVGSNGSVKVRGIDRPIMERNEDSVDSV